MAGSRVAAILVLAAVLGAGGAHAQIFQCRQAGSLVFSDRPCAEGGQPVKAAATGPQGDVRFEVPTRHYTVSAPTLGRAYLSMRANNPGGFAGWARWKVDYDLDHEEAGGRCSVRRVRVHVVGDILMPQWAEEKQVAAEEQAQWRAMYAALKRHEDGHIQHGREFALLLKERLLGLGTVPCRELAPRAQQEYTQLHGNLQRRDADYDQRTDHGLRQDNPR